MTLFNIVIIILCSFIVVNNGLLPRNLCENLVDDFDTAQIILYYAPLNINSIRGQIAIYYYNPEFRRGDVVALNINHTVNDYKQKTSVTYFYYPTTMKGIIYTKMQVLTEIPSNYINYTQECSGYFGYWIRNGTKASKSSCLSTYPDWMYQQKRTLYHKKLSSIIIPGTHNSGTYSDIQPQPTIYKFTVTQDLNILDQLVFGARYIDLRPGYNENQYWIYHGNFRMNHLSSIIYNVKEFITNTKEIVILSFKEFPIGFNTKDDHRNFINYLQQQFHGLLLRRLPELWNVRLGDMWDMNCRLIICYDHDIYETTHNIWPPIYQLWGDVDTVDGLKEYLTHVESIRFSIPKAAMAAVTLSTWTVITHALADVIGLDHTSLIYLAALVGPKITQWYNELLYQNASIIAVDYIEGTGIVPLAIHWNKKKFSMCYQWHSN